MPSGTLVQVIAGEVWSPACVNFGGMSVPSGHAAMDMTIGFAAGAAGAAGGAWAAAVAASPAKTKVGRKTRKNRIGFNLSRNLIVILNRLRQWAS